MTNTLLAVTADIDMGTRIVIYLSLPLATNAVFCS